MRAPVKWFGSATTLAEPRKSYTHAARSPASVACHARGRAIALAAAKLQA